MMPAATGIILELMKKPAYAQEPAWNVFGGQHERDQLVCRSGDEVGRVERTQVPVVGDVCRPERGTTGCEQGDLAERLADVHAQQQRGQFEEGPQVRRDDVAAFDWSSGSACSPTSRMSIANGVQRHDVSSPKAARRLPRPAKSLPATGSVQDCYFSSACRTVLVPASLMDSLLVALLKAALRVLPAVLGRVLLAVRTQGVDMELHGLLGLGRRSDDGAPAVEERARRERARRGPGRCPARHGPSRSTDAEGPAPHRAPAHEHAHMTTLAGARRPAGLPLCVLPVAACRV